ncbi:DUF6085 family protein [Streptomyces albidoflavus]
MTANPTVQGFCPACGGVSLFLGEGGYVTCARLACPEPDAASTLLQRGRSLCASAAFDRQPHQPHGWKPQPDMEPVYCPGFPAV